MAEQLNLSWVNVSMYSINIQRTKLERLLVKCGVLSLILLGCCLFQACTSDVISDPTENENEGLHYLALGDSYTIGQGIDAESAWPQQLAEQLEQQDISIDEVSIIAKTGWTTRQLLDAIDREAPQPQDLVSLLIGVNNQFQKQDFSIFQAEFDELLSRSLELAFDRRNRVFVVSIPDYGVTPFGADRGVEVGVEIDKYNNFIRERCVAMDISYIDVTGISRELMDEEDALASDQLHPSALQYAMWVEVILPKVKELLCE